MMVVIQGRATAGASEDHAVGWRQAARQRQRLSSAADEQQAERTGKPGAQEAGASLEQMKAAIALEEDYFGGGPVYFWGGPVYFSGGPVYFWGGPVYFWCGPIHFWGGPVYCLGWSCLLLEWSCMHVG